MTQDTTGTAALPGDKPLPRPEQILRYFKYEHLPASLAAVSKIFADAARDLLELVPAPGAERTVALRKLLEGKDAAVRAALPPETL